MGDKNGPVQVVEYHCKGCNYLDYDSIYICKNTDHAKIKMGEFYHEGIRVIIGINDLTPSSCPFLKGDAEK